MTAVTPLRGTDLIDCAKANRKQGIELAAQRCGYGEDLATFEQELKQACAHIGIEMDGFNDLSTDRQASVPDQVTIISPDTSTQL